MSKLDELIEELCPAGVQYKKLNEIAHYAKKRIDITEIDKNTYVGVENLLQNKQGKTVASSVPNSGKVIRFEIGDILIGNIRPYLRKIWLSDCIGGTNGDVLAIQINDRTEITPEFLYYIISSEKFFLYDVQNSRGAKMPRGDKDVVMKYKLPVPPLEVQCEIVHILDSFTLLTAELTAELTARKKQYEFYRDKLLTFSENKVKYLPLGELYPDIRNGFVGTVTPFFSNKENGVLYLRGTNVHDGFISNEDVVYVSKEFHEKHNRTELKSDDIIMVQSGHVGECAVVGEAYAGANCHALIVMSNGGKCNSKYIVYYFHSYEGRKKLDAITTGGTVKHILASKMKKVIVPIPPLEVQNRLVNVLDNLEAICTDLNIGLPAEIEARQKQYEYYRDLLLTFAETGSTLMTDRQTDRQTELSAIKLIQYVFGYAMLPLGKVANVFRGEYITKKNTKEGTIPVILGGQEPAYYIDKYNHDGEIVVVARSGASAGFVSYWNQKIFVTDGFGYEEKSELIATKFLYYVLKNMESELNAMKRGAGVPHVSGEMLNSIELPIPSLQDQQRIVEILERFDTLCNDLSAGLPAEIKVRQKQYEYYRDKLLSFKELPK